MADDRYRDNDWRGDRYGGRGRGSSIFSDDGGDQGRRGGRDWNPEEKGWGRGSEGGSGRGLFDRARSEVRSWFGDDEGGSWDRGSERSRYGQGQSGFGGETYRSNQSGGGGREEGGGSGGGGFGGYGGSTSGQSHFDENYRRWRDQQIAQLDREYEDYCRERQQRFESDFGSWRQSRAGQSGQGQSGRNESFGEAGGESSSSSRSALLGDESAGATTTGGGEASAMESSTGSSPDAGTGTGGRGRS